jgi:hypothetical protein
LTSTPNGKHSATTYLFDSASQEQIMRNRLRRRSTIATMAFIAANLLLGGLQVRRAAAQEFDACLPGEECRCFSPSYCTDWPIGATCGSSNDCASMSE